MSKYNSNRILGHPKVQKFNRRAGSKKSRRLQGKNKYSSGYSGIGVRDSLDRASQLGPNDVKNIRIVDYFTQGRKLGHSNNLFKTDETQSNISAKVG
jgi:hypothetical protein